MSNKKKQIRQQFRDSVFKRARYRCEVCNAEGRCRQTGAGYKNGEELDAHHIKRRELCTDGGYILSNGIALCSSCHILAEQYEYGPLPPQKLFGIINENK